MNKFWEFKALGNAGELFLYGEISDTSWWGDEITPAQFQKELAALGDISTLDVYINSPGGDIFAGFSLYNILNRHPATKTVHIDGLAASAASVVAMAGDETLISPTGMIMIHNPMTYASGNKSDMEQAIRLLDEVKESIINAYARKTKLSRDKISGLMDEETWFNAEKALQLGFADGILFDESDDKNPTSMMYSVSKSRNAFLNKISADSSGTPIEQLEKRLSLLKY